MEVLLASRGMREHGSDDDDGGKLTRGSVRAFVFELILGMKDENIVKALCLSEKYVIQ